MAASLQEYKEKTLNSNRESGQGLEEQKFMLQDLYKIRQGMEQEHVWRTEVEDELLLQSERIGHLKKSFKGIFD
jgi:hypothetical protein